MVPFEIFGAVLLWAMEHFRTAQLVAHSVELANQSLFEINRLARAIEAATELVNSSIDCIETSKKAMARATRVMW